MEDKRYISDPDQRSIAEVTQPWLVVGQRVNMEPNSGEGRRALATYRHSIEGVNS